MRIAEGEDDFYSFAPSRRHEYLLSMVDARGRMGGSPSRFDPFTR